jgi:hypothetical protein
VKTCLSQLFAVSSEGINGVIGIFVEINPGVPSLFSLLCILATAHADGSRSCILRPCIRFNGVNIDAELLYVCSSHPFEGLQVSF